MSPRILLIEDTVDLGEILSEILSMEGFDTTWAKDPVTALSIFESKQPDLVITDLVMTEMSGLEVIKNIRRKPASAQLPIIVLSAKASPEDEALTYKTGGNLHLKKPCDSTVLIESIKSLLHHGNEKTN